MLLVFASIRCPKERMPQDILFPHSVLYNRSVEQRVCTDLARYDSRNLVRQKCCSCPENASLQFQDANPMSSFGGAHSSIVFQCFSSLGRNYQLPKWIKIGLV